MDDALYSDKVAYSLSVFEGPLDLLLHLLKKNKVSIYEIPIAEITEQYLDYMKTCDKYDIEYSSEFIVMASELLLIKSKMLLPRQETTEEEDPRADLATRLLEYQKTKIVAEFLKDKEFSDRQSFYKRAEILPKAEADYSDQSFDINKLWSAFLTVLDKRERKEPPSKKVFGGIVGHEPVSVKSRADYITKRLTAKKKISFSAIFEDTHSRPHVIATFLAILEMIKLEIITAQETDDGIYLEKIKDGEIVDEYSFDS